MHEKMTLQQIASGYREAAGPLRRRLRELRQALKTASDPEEIFRLKRRIAELTPMLSECNALAQRLFRIGIFQLLYVGSKLGNGFFRACQICFKSRIVKSFIDRIQVPNFVHEQ